MLGFFLCDEFGYNPDMRLVVGLGNPGSKYEETRHNVGFMWCDDLVRINHATFQDNGKFFSEVTRVGGGRSDVWILKPQTFMNESGHELQTGGFDHQGFAGRHEAGGLLHRASDTERNGHDAGRSPYRER